MLRGRESGTSPFVCTQRTHVAGTVHKLVDTRRRLVHVIVEGTVFKSSALENFVQFVPVSVMTREFKPAEFHATCFKNSPYRDHICYTVVLHYAGGI